MRRAPPLIVGAGPAGCAAAITLAAAGHRPMMIERHRETPDALCGGFLSWRTLKSLSRLGIEPSGHAVARLRIFSGDITFESSLPGRAIGISRRALDTAMQFEAERLGTRFERGVKATSWRHDGLVVGDSRLEGPVFLATGKSDLRGLGRERATHADAAVGLRVRAPASPALRRLVGETIELHLFDGGYAGIVLQENGGANICMAVRKSRLDDAGGRPDRLLRQISRGALGERLALARNDAIDAIGHVPYGWQANATDAVYRLGDQAAVIPSLAGEGMGIAIASGIAAADAWIAGVAPHDFQRAFARRARRPVAVATRLWHWAENPSRASAALRTLRYAPTLTRLLAALTRIGD